MALSCFHLSRIDLTAVLTAALLAAGCNDDGSPDGEPGSGAQSCESAVVEPVSGLNFEENVPFAIGDLLASWQRTTTQSFGAAVAGDGCLAMWPAMLDVDLGTLGCGITTVELDIFDQCGPGCTRAEGINEGNVIASESNGVTSAIETLTLTSPSGPASEPPSLDRLHVASNEGYLCGMRLHSSEASFTVVFGTSPFPTP